MNYKIANFLIIILPFCASGIGRCAAPIQLAESSRTKYVITLAVNASAPEKNAAAELSIYLHDITGAEFTITNPQSASPQMVIAVGPGALKAIMPALSLEKSKLGDDGIIMKSSGSNIILTGAVGSKRGTLYAVYTFLEDICGVRWWTSNEISQMPSFICVIKRIANN